jgi:flagellar basal-body rod protein FlgF
MDPVSLTAASLQMDLQRMNVIANNAANALTPGFRRELLVASGQFTASANMAAGNAPLTQAALPRAYVAFDSTPGAPRMTSIPLDLALLGDGYFEVTTPQGPAYTRHGAFRLDPQGHLVTQAGLPVSGVGGDIRLSSDSPVIDREGRITEQGKQTGQIKVVNFERSTQLQSIGGGLYVPTGDARGTEMTKPRLAQGQLESSNVDSAREMAKLVETFRHFEGSSKLLQAYDDVRDKTFRALGQF